MTDQQEDRDKLTFCCSNLGQQDCDWRTSGQDEDDLVRSIEEHAREHHNMVIDQDVHQKIRDAIGPGKRAA
jgi:predicted small metal-binding protein